MPWRSCRSVECDGPQLKAFAAETARERREFVVRDGDRVHVVSVVCSDREIPGSVLVPEGARYVSVRLRLDASGPDGRAAS